MAILTADGPATHSDPGTASSRSLRYAAGFCLASAAIIHVAVAPEHLREWWPAGVFFLAVAFGQAALAGGLLVRPTEWFVRAAIWSSVGLVTLYVWSRTAGLPFMPVHSGEEHSVGEHAGHAVGGRGNGVPIFPHATEPSSVEPVGSVDMAALALGLGIVVALIALLPTAPRRRTANAICAFGLALVLLRATSVLS